MQEFNKLVKNFFDIDNLEKKKEKKKERKREKQSIKEEPYVQ